MKKISKIIVLIITLTLIACISTSVWAEDEPIDLSNSLTGGNSTTENNTTDNNTVDNNVTDNNTTDNNTTNTTTDNNTTNTTTENEPANNTVQDLTPSTSNNTSTYPESNIPHAGVEPSALLAVAFVVCAIIGIYTFMKLSDYSNI